MHRRSQRLAGRASCPFELHQNMYERAGRLAQRELPYSVLRTYTSITRGFPAEMHVLCLYNALPAREGSRGVYAVSLVVI